MKPLYKTTYVLWTEYSTEFTVDDLALQGDDYCSKRTCTLVEDPSSDPDMDADGLEWFNPEEDEE